MQVPIAITFIMYENISHPGLVCGWPLCVARVYFPGPRPDLEVLIDFLPDLFLHIEEPNRRPRYVARTQVSHGAHTTMWPLLVGQAPGS